MLLDEPLASLGAGEPESALTAAPLPDSEPCMLQAVDDALRRGLGEAQCARQMRRSDAGEPCQEIQCRKATGVIGWGGEVMFGRADAVDEGEADRAGAAARCRTPPGGPACTPPPARDRQTLPGSGTKPRIKEMSAARSRAVPPALRIAPG